jgi:hypothetical protein
MDVVDSRFNVATAALVDACQRLFRPRQLLKLGKALKLDTRKPVTVAAS